MPEEQHAVRAAREPRAIDHVRAVIEDRSQQVWIIRRIVFEVGILNENDVARGVFESRAEGRTLAAVDGMRNDFDPAHLLKFPEDVAGAVGGGVVHENDFIFQAAGIRSADAAKNLLDRVGLIEDGNQDRQTLEAITYLGREYRRWTVPPSPAFFPVATSRRAWYSS